MDSNWDRPDAHPHDHARRSRPQKEEPARHQHPAGDRWVEEGLELRRARRRRADLAEDDG